MPEHAGQGADTPTAPRGTPGAGDGAGSASGVDAPTRADGDPGDTGASGDRELRGMVEDLQRRFDEVKTERDAMKAERRSEQELRSKVLETLGIVDVKDEDDPKAMVKSLRDELAQEREARQESERRLLRQHVLAGVTDAKQARIALAGLEATGAVSLSPDDPSTAESARRLLEADFPHLFKAAEKQERTRVPAPRNGRSDFELPKELYVDGKRFL